MSRILLIILTISISTYSYSKEIVSGKLLINIPDEWSITGTIIYNKSNEKIGELISKNTWNYSTGNGFVSAFKKGFFDDPETTKFISSGQKGNVFWVCRVATYEDGKGGFGDFYVRSFWNNGPILTLYSYISCDDDFDHSISIARTLKEK